jgi:hypothetical protein
MLVLLAAVYACMELRGFAPKGSELRANMKSSISCWACPSWRWWW